MMDAGDRVPAGLRETTKRRLSQSRDRLCAAWNGKRGGRLRYAYAPRFILSCTEKLFRAVASRGVTVHSHVAEHPDERKAVKRALGDTDIAILRRMGREEVRGPCSPTACSSARTPKWTAIAKDDTRIVPALSERELEARLRDRARARNRSGAGSKVALGADGAPCNEITSIRGSRAPPRAALLSRRCAPVSTTLNAGSARRSSSRRWMVPVRSGSTIEVGSLEEGKRADVVVVRLDGPHVEPGGDAFIHGSSTVAAPPATSFMSSSNGEHRRSGRRPRDGSIVKTVRWTRARAEAKKLPASRASRLDAFERGRPATSGSRTSPSATARLLVPSL